MYSTEFFRRLHNLIWLLIFVGIAVVSVGFAVRDAAANAFPFLVGAGALMVAAGAVLIYLRSRMPPTPPDGSEPRPARDGGR
jgi:multidrug transporter EmrE-like cation transporter